jgi:C4-dicarboxylate transporter DctM subunit
MSIFLMMMAVFLVFVFLGIPVSFSIGLSTVAAVLAKGMPLAFVSQMAFTGLDSYTYLAIPMFILDFLCIHPFNDGNGRMSRLVNFAASLVGNIHGGLGIITVLACAFFAAISGSSPGTVAAVGAMMIPPMVEKGYDRDFSAALTASAGSLGVLIPPSIPMVLYCIAGEVSIGEMFMAGFIPGFLMTAALALTYVISKKNGYKSDEGEFEWKKVAASFKEAIWPLLAPVIILGGIYSGIFTPTEAAVVVVVYSMFVGLFITKELKVSDLPGILYKGAVTAGTTVFILAFAMAFSRYLTLNQIPQLIGSVILGITGNVHVILILFVLLCFVTGTFLETASQVLIYTPLFLPTLKGLGVSPLHFGILLTVGTMLGMMTPPVGINLFVAQGISGAKISKMTKAILPFLFVMLFVQILFVFFPGFSTFLPGLFSK